MLALQFENQRGLNTSYYLHVSYNSALTQSAQLLVQVQCVIDELYNVIFRRFSGTKSYKNNLKIASLQNLLQLETLKYQVLFTLIYNRPLLTKHKKASLWKSWSRTAFPLDFLWLSSNLFWIFKIWLPQGIFSLTSSYIGLHEPQSYPSDIVFRSCFCQYTRFLPYIVGGVHFPVAALHWVTLQ